MKYFDKMVSTAFRVDSASLVFTLMSSIVLTYSFRVLQRAFKF